MSSEQTLLGARGAGRRFGQTTALEPIDLEIAPGEGLALVGPNGAGKSTLIALLAGALEPSVGRIERRTGVRVGWAPQRPAQYGRLSARENLELFARLEGEPEPEAAAARLLRDFDLPGTIWDLRFLSEKAKHNILGGNAARLFKLPPRNEQQKEHLRRFGNLVA